MRQKIEEYAVKQLITKFTEDNLKGLDLILARVQENFERDEFTELTKADIEFYQFYMTLPVVRNCLICGIQSLCA